MQRTVKLFLELVVHEIRGFVQNQQLRVEITARASSTRCIWPPDTSPIGWRAVSAIPDEASSAIAFRGPSRVWGSGTRGGPAIPTARLRAPRSETPGRNPTTAAYSRSAAPCPGTTPAPNIFRPYGARFRVWLSRVSSFRRRWDYDTQEIVVADFQIDMLNGFVSVVCDAYVAHRYQIHFAVIKSVIVSMFAMASPSQRINRHVFGVDVSGYDLHGRCRELLLVEYPAYSILPGLPDDCRQLLGRGPLPSVSMATCRSP